MHGFLVLAQTHFCYKQKAGAFCKITIRVKRLTFIIINSVWSMVSAPRVFTKCYKRVQAKQSGGFLSDQQELQGLRVQRRDRKMMRVNIVTSSISGFSVEQLFRPATVDEGVFKSVTKMRMTYCQRGSLMRRRFTFLGKFQANLEENTLN